MKPMEERSMHAAALNEHLCLLRLERRTLRDVGLQFDMSVERVRQRTMKFARQLGRAMRHTKFYFPDDPEKTHRCNELNSGWKFVCWKCSQVTEGEWLHTDIGESARAYERCTYCGHKRRAGYG